MNVVSVLHSTKDKAECYIIIIRIILKSFGGTCRRRTPLGSCDTCLLRRSLIMYALVAWTSNVHRICRADLHLTHNIS